MKEGPLIFSAQMSTYRPSSAESVVPESWTMLPRRISKCSKSQPSSRFPAPSFRALLSCYPGLPAQTHETNIPRCARAERPSEDKIMIHYLDRRQLFS